MTAETDVSDVQSYEVVPGNPVTLEIEVLFKQIGGPVVAYREQVMDYTGAMKLDTSDAVEMCSTRTKVKDVNQNTDETKVRYRLSGGVRSQTYDYAAMATAGGIVTYRITFVFVPRA